MGFQVAVDLLKFVNLTNEIIAIPLGNLRISNMDHSTIDIEIHLQVKLSLNPEITIGATINLMLTSEPDCSSPSNPEVPLVQTTFFILCLKQSKWVRKSSSDISKNAAIFETGIVVYRRK